MKLKVANLFCGAGGMTAGLVAAARDRGIDLDLASVDICGRAIETHSRNISGRHYCQPVGEVEPLLVFPSGADLIIAGVECTNHSQARGAKEMSKESRAQAWDVTHWAKSLVPRDILVENVPAFKNWGPLDESNRPIKFRRGESFKAWIKSLEDLGYRVEHRVLNCADYGDPTTRKRLFIRARKGGRAICWPGPTHAQQKRHKLLGLEPWIPAREIIDWSDLGISIFKRRKPLAKRTLARIRAGIERYAGPLAQTFLDLLDGKQVETIPADALEHSTAKPFVLPHDQWTASNGPHVDPIGLPLIPLTANNSSCTYFCAPFFVPHFGERPGQPPRNHSPDLPLPTITATKGGPSVVAPFLVKYYGTATAASIAEPLGTATTKARFALTTLDGHALDIYFRMLRPAELARAQEFPDGWEWPESLTKGDLTRQIGNAVPVNTARALCASILEGRS